MPQVPQPRCLRGRALVLLPGERIQHPVPDRSSLLLQVLVVIDSGAAHIRHRGGDDRPVPASIIAGKREGRIRRIQHTDRIRAALDIDRASPRIDQLERRRIETGGIDQASASQIHRRGLADSGNVDHYGTGINMQCALAIFGQAVDVVASAGEMHVTLDDQVSQETISSSGRRTGARSQTEVVAGAAVRGALGAADYARAIRRAVI